MCFLTAVSSLMPVLAEHKTLHPPPPRPLSRPAFAAHRSSRPRQILDPAILHPAAASYLFCPAATSSARSRRTRGTRTVASASPQVPPRPPPRPGPCPGRRRRRLLRRVRRDPSPDGPRPVRRDASARVRGGQGLFISRACICICSCVCVPAVSRTRACARANAPAACATRRKRGSRPRGSAAASRRPGIPRPAITPHTAIPGPRRPRPDDRRRLNQLCSGRTAPDPPRTAPDPPRTAPDPPRVDARDHAPARPVLGIVWPRMHSARVSLVGHSAWCGHRDYFARTHTLHGPSMQRAGGAEAARGAEAGARRSVG